MSPILPVASPAQVRGAIGRLLRTHRRELVVTFVLHVAAVAAALVGPRVLGAIVDTVRDGGGRSRVDALALVFGVALAVQSLLMRQARLKAGLLGETVLAGVREDFLRDSVRLPLDTVERAGTGDLVARATTDVDRMSFAVRFGVPEIGVALLQLALISVAVVVTAPVLSLGLLAGLPVLVPVTRWYRRRAPAAYQREMAAEARVTAGVIETAEAGRTVEALGLSGNRVRRTDGDVGVAWAAMRWTTWLRSVFYAGAEIGYLFPMVAVLLLGGVGVREGFASVGEVTAVALYVQMLIAPLDAVLSWLDEMQIGLASMARLIGVGVAPAHETSPDVPVSDELVAADVRFAYRDDHDVLHGLSLSIAPGTRLAVVGPSGAGKSTLGRLLAGIHAPRTGTVTIGGAAVATLPADVLREQVALVTQEHHVFVGAIRENVALARPGSSDADVRAALAAVDALPWVDALPAGLDTVVGSGGHRLTPAQAQQVALARLVLADPHTLVLDEATSLLDPRAARHLERSLAAVLRGRTVVAIAHRLHTAHDADVVAVVADGRLIELGPHDELLQRGGSYAELWASWRAGTRAPTS